MSEVKKLLSRGRKTREGDSNNKSALFVNPELHQDFKEFCATRGCTLREITEAVLSDFLNEQNHERTKK